MKPRQASSAFAGALLLSLSVHAIPIIKAVNNLVDTRLFIEEARTTIHDYLVGTYEIELQKEPPPLPPPEQPKTEIKAPEEATPPPKSIDKHPAPPPAAAQAGQTLTAKEDPSKPVEFTDFSMVQGNANMYAGGVTASSGTSKDAVYDSNARANGVPGGKGTPNASSTAGQGSDLSRIATPQGKDWNCSHLFPAEADANDINSALVSVVVTVRPDGTAQSVSVVNDPGHGFGRAARSCALGQHYSPALDRTGHPVLSTTPPFHVRFTR